MYVASFTWAKSLTKFNPQISAVATRGPGSRASPNGCLCPPILVYSKYFFGGSRSLKTTDNDVKRNNYVQT